MTGDTPAAVIARGTTPRQQAVTGTLATIADDAADVRPPADHRGRRRRRAARRRSPGPSGGRCTGVTVAVTRARTQACDLVRRLRDLGAGVIEAPVIRIEPLAGAPIDASAYDLVCLTSPNAPAPAARPHRRRRPAAGRASRWRRSAPARPRRCARSASCADVVAERAVAEGLLEALADRVAGRARAGRAGRGGARHAARRPARRRRRVGRRRAALPHGGRASPRRRRRAGRRPRHVHVVVDGARSSHAAFAGRDLRRVRGVSIGPVTSATMRELGIADRRRGRRPRPRRPGRGRHRGGREPVARRGRHRSVICHDAPGGPRCDRPTVYRSPCSAAPR